MGLIIHCVQTVNRMKTMNQRLFALQSLSFFKKITTFIAITLPIYLFSLTSAAYANLPRELRDLYFKAFSTYHKAFRPETKQSDREGIFQSALKQINFVLKVAPTYEEALQLRSQINDSLGDKEGALKDINKAIKVNPTNPENYSDRGEIYNPYIKSNWDKILNDYKKAITLSTIGKDEYSDYSQASWYFYQRSSHYFYQRKDYDKALKDLNEATKLIAFQFSDFSRRNIYRSLRSKTFLALGNIKAACYDYNLVKDRNPNYNFYFYGKNVQIIKDNC